MPSNTRSTRKGPETDIPDPEPEADAPETDESTEAPTVTETDSAPTTDEAPEPATTDEPEIPALPDNWVAEHPLVAEAHELVIQAEARKGDPTPITDFVAAADKLFGTDTGFAVVEALQEAGTDIEAALATTDAFRTIVDTLRDKREVVDRDDGNNLLDALVALVKTPRGGIESESDKVAIPILMARWRASAPKRATGTGTPRTGESDIPFLFYPNGKDLRVRYVCGTCGKKFSTRKDNLNSARNECIKHSRTHGKNLADGTTDYKEVTNGLYLTGLGDPSYKGKHAKEDELVDQVDRGGWRFIRVEAS